MAQGSLFGDAVIEKSFARSYAIERTPTVVFGETDRSGKYWYERFHADAMKLDVDARETLFRVILDWPYERMDSFRVLLDRFSRAGVGEQQNFTEAMGR
jgi:hypothetical protein